MLITNIVEQLDTNGMVVGMLRTVTNDSRMVFWDGFKYGMTLGALFATFWAIRGLWRAFVGGDSQSD